jgi:hypothetical protein
MSLHIANANSINITVTPTWQRFVISISDPAVDAEIRLSGNAASGTVADVVARFPQFELGSTATPYQRVGATQFDITEQGQPDNWYLYGGGASDPRWMQTPAIDFTSTDKMTVWAGVKKLSDATQGTVLELSPGANNGTFTMQHSVSGSANWRAAFRGTTQGFLLVSPIYPAPRYDILSAYADIGSGEATFRISGETVAEGLRDFGTGNYGNYPLFLGSRGGTSLFFNGKDYGLIVRGAETDQATLEKVEKLIAQNIPTVTL